MSERLVVPVDHVREPRSSGAESSSQGAIRHPHHEEIYRPLFERSLDGILLIGPSGAILDANPVACSLLAMSKEEICAVGRQGVTVAGSELEHAVEHLASTGQVSAEATCVRKDGSFFPAEFTSFVLPTADGSFLAFLIFHRARGSDRRRRRFPAEALHRREAGPNRQGSARENPLASWRQLRIHTVR
jgi:PAS domain S-box-containing protein